MAAGGYAGRHWRGEQSLAQSFWVNNGLLAIPFGLAVGGLAVWITIKGDWLRGGSIAVLLAWPLLLAFNVWALVGAWRSSGGYLESGGSALWGWGARVVLLFGAVSLVASTVLDFAPNVGSYLRMARGIDPIGHLQATLSPDGRKLKLAGPVGMGDAGRVRTLMDGAKGLQWVELDSPGGRMKEAEALAAGVRQRGLQTRTTGTCDSACTLVYLAGGKRQVMPGAKLGFHRASSGTLNPVLDAMANRELAEVYRRAGLPESFVVRAMATPPHRMWHPARDELVAGGLVTVPERPLDVELPVASPAAATPSDFVDALIANDTWFALERRFPGTVAQAAARLTAGQAAGTSGDALQAEGQRVVESRIIALLEVASAETRELYLGLMAEQLKAARSIDVTACAQVLALDAGARRNLPPVLAQRESTWLIDAATELPRDGPGRASTTLEREVMRRRLGDRAPALLDSLWRPGATDRSARDCDKALELIAAVLALPGAERKLATRLVFDQR